MRAPGRAGPVREDSQALILDRSAVGLPPKPAWGEAPDPL